MYIVGAARVTDWRIRDKDSELRGNEKRIRCLSGAPGGTNGSSERKNDAGG